jgi:hypothetical protein
MSEQGETVNLQFSSSDASTAAAVGIFDSNGGVRTLASHERLLIDTLQGNISGTGVTKLDLFGSADGTVDAGERVACFGSGAAANMFEAGCEGYALPVGVGLKAKANAAGQVDVTGSARIIKGQSEGQHPSWRE